LVKEANMNIISTVTRGVIFFGTPHQDGRTQSVGMIAAKAARANFPSLTHAMAKAFEQDSSLESINNTFREYLEKRLGEHAVQVTSFYDHSVCCRDSRR
jgi:2-polyprenyl-3-methyl-5-hydroxy-6-metoxy-1,4-benzoquinol methylase